MNLFDIIIVILCALLTVRGVWVGFIRQLSFLVALALGYIAAGQFHGAFSHRLDPFISNRQLGFLLTYLLLFLAVYITVMLVGLVLRKVMQISFLGWFDRLVGGVFGLAKGVLLVHIVFIVLGFVAPAKSFLSRSFFYPYLTQSSQVLLSLIETEDLRRSLLPKAPAINAIPSTPSASPAVEPGKETRRNAEKKPDNNNLVK